MTNSKKNLEKANILLKGARHKLSEQTYGTALPNDYMDNYWRRIVHQLSVEITLAERINHERLTFLSIGAWPGLTALGMKSLGFRVIALDHPSVMTKTMMAWYEKHGIVAVQHDMIDSKRITELIEFPVDIVECCECIEHWAFNPNISQI